MNTEIRISESQEKDETPKPSLVSDPHQARPFPGQTLPGIVRSAAFGVLPVLGLRQDSTPQVGLRTSGFATVVLPGLAIAVLLLAGCAAPIRADRVTNRQAYAQVESNALRNGKPSDATVSVLHRFDLEELAAKRPDEAVRRLHEKALATGDRDLLFALSEMSYVAGDQIRRSVKPWEPREARDYYLGSAVYAWLFLFGEGRDPLPGAFDRRFREACDFYNHGLGRGFSEGRGTNASVRLESARRRLPVGELAVQFETNTLAAQFEQAEQILPVDRYRVRGFSVRNREAGLGTPLMAVKPIDPRWGLHPVVPGTVLLQLQGSLADLGAGDANATLELFSPFEETDIQVGSTQVPIETDLTTYRAYMLSQSRVWKLGRLDFLAPAEHIPSQLILNQPYQPDRIPVVFVHGTFSSPVTWAEMANTLTADPVLRRRYQIWSFIYGSGNPLLTSIAEFRAAMTAEVNKLDPEGTNAALHQMVVIGHSQGGLLTKAAAVDTGDRMWRVMSTNQLETLDVSDAERETLRAMFFLKPLPFVTRVVFIATPHRGSYQSGRLVRWLGQLLVSLPQTVVAGGKTLVELTQGSESAKFFRGKMPTSLDGMSPKNPGLLTMAEIPVAPEITAHSIVALRGDNIPPAGGDGVVKYSSAHVEYVESELIVRSFHTCLEKPAAIEEVRRILYEHLEQLK
jgi:pimeloyl-ACP methyl ester carboxylesterase